MPQNRCAIRNWSRYTLPGNPARSFAALIAVDLGTPEGGAFAAPAAEPQVDMVAGQDDLVGRRAGIAADQDPHRVHAGPAREELFGNSRPAFLGQSGIQKVGQQSSLTTAEAEEDVAAAAPDAAVVVLPQRMIVGHTGLGALLRVQRGIQLAGERVETFEVGARPGGSS